MKTLLTGKWLALTLAAIVACAVMLALAQWQWSQAQSSNKTAPTRVTPVDQLVRLDIGVVTVNVGWPVSATGTYVPQTQVRVAGQHDAHGNNADWVVTALREASGVLVTVVRGVIAPGAALPAPPAGPVTVIGTLQASSDVGASNNPPTTVSTWLLTQQWKSRLRDGYVVLRSSTPAQSGLELVPQGAVHVHRGLPVWRNITYAVQWVIFAGFVVFIWFRASRDQLKAQQQHDNENTVGLVAAQPNSEGEL